MPVISLNQPLVSTLQCPEGKRRIEYCDADMPGLLLEVRPSGTSTYWLRYRSADGQTHYSKLGASSVISLVEARKKAKMVKADIALNGADPRAETKAKRDAPTLNEFFNDCYMPLARAHKRSWLRDTQSFSRLGKQFGHLKITDLAKHKMEIISFHAALPRTDGISEASADHIAKLLRRICTVACESGLLSTNPFSRFKLFNPDNRRERYLSADELKRLVTVLNEDPKNPTSMLFLFLLSTGVRLNEAVCARWDQIDREQRVWRIPAANSKSKRSRVVPLNDTALGVLDCLDTEGRHEYLFVNKRFEKKFTNVNKPWQAIREKASLPGLRIHDLRHAMASMLAQSGRSLYEIQHILGHASPLVTQRYAHLSQQTLHDASNSASVMIQQAMQQKEKETA